MSEEKRIPLYIYDYYDPQKQEEWLRKQKEEKEKKEQKRGYELIDFNIDNDLLIDEIMS